jgi:hypothetical protein
LLDQLAKHLSILQRQTIIESRHDRKIQAGEEWDRKIDSNLESAQIILLLVSPDFVASDYCYEKEVEKAMQRYESGQSKVIPVILRPVDLSGTPFSKLQALPKNAEPVTKWQNEDEAFYEIAQAIKLVVETFVQENEAKLKLQEYEIKYFEAIQQGFPIKEEVVNQLDEMQKNLGLLDKDTSSIEGRFTTPFKGKWQKLLSYRKEVKIRIERDEGELSPLSRTILNETQQKLGLTLEEAKQIEDEIIKPFTLGILLQKEKAKKYEQSYFDIIKRGLPISDKDCEDLELLQKILELSFDDVNRIKKFVNESAEGIVSGTPPEDEGTDLDEYYVLLRDYLSAGKFKEADMGTYTLILKTLEQEKRDWISEEGIKNFPCKKLQTIDNLWKKYSNGRFGFSIQKQLFEKVGGKGKTCNLAVFRKFGDKVGWRVNGDWLPYENLTFNPDAPEGHLPGWFGGLNIVPFFSRITDCKIGLNSSK